MIFVEFGLGPAILPSYLLDTKSLLLLGLKGYISDTKLFIVFPLKACGIIFLRYISLAIVKFPEKLFFDCLGSYVYKNSSINVRNYQEGPAIFLYQCFEAL